MRNDCFLQPEEWKVDFLRVNQNQAHSGAEWARQIWKDTPIANEHTQGIDEVQVDLIPHPPLLPL